MVTSKKPAVKKTPAKKPPVKKATTPKKTTAKKVVKVAEPENSPVKFYEFKMEWIVKCTDVNVAVEEVERLLDAVWEYDEGKNLVDVNVSQVELVGYEQ